MKEFVLGNTAFLPISGAKWNCKGKGADTIADTWIFFNLCRVMSNGITPCNYYGQAWHLPPGARLVRFISSYHTQSQTRFSSEKMYLKSIAITETKELNNNYCH